MYVFWKYNLTIVDLGWTYVDYWQPGAPTIFGYDDVA